MERRFAVRKQEMLAECEVSVKLFHGMAERLVEFVEPFAACLGQPAQRNHAEKYVAGLLSDLKRKNVESIAYRHDEDRRNLQHFIGTAAWDHRPLVQTLVAQVGEALGEADAVIVFDPSAFRKKGTQSVGVARQWCGRYGKIDNCQVAVYMGYVARNEHVLVDTRLYLPEPWASDRRRKAAAGVPKNVRFQTRHQQALEMLGEHRDKLPHGWVAGDDEMGRSTVFRRDLRVMNERYLLAVPSNTTVRDLEAQQPVYSGRGTKPKRPFEQARRWRESLSEDAWRRVTVRDGEKGPLEVDIITRRVEAKTDRRRVGPEETFVVVRSLDEDGATKHDYYLSNAPNDTPLREFARVALAAHRVEECIKRAKSETGLADYEVRNWAGWHHHQVLSLMAVWFLVQETRLGKKTYARIDRSTSARRLGHAPTSYHSACHASPHRTRQNTPPATQRRSTLLPLEIT
jgi:SRSO17 transposase